MIGYRYFWRICCLLLLACSGLLMVAPARAMDVTAVRVGVHDGFHRLVVEAERPFDYSIFTLEKPDRLVIDIPSARWQAVTSGLASSSLVKDTRHGRPKSGVLRIVADLTQAVHPPKDFTLPKKNEEPFKLVVDMAPAGAPLPAATTKAAAAPPSEEAIASAPVPTPKPTVPGSQTYVIMIDPGHGGVDPGAISRKGTHEKDITLEYAKALAASLNRLPQYKAQLTRKDDRYLRLRERIAIARQQKANLFISLHADSAPNRRARGLSVYTLSETASDKEAAMLARRENKSDIISGMDLSDKSSDVANILIDLAQRETKNKSSLLAEIIIKELDSRVYLVKNSHRFAGFAVLKAPDIPSVLVELGFLSNRDDEKLLRSAPYREKLVKSMAQAVRRYFEETEGEG